MTKEDKKKLNEFAFALKMLNMKTQNPLGWEAFTYEMFRKVRKEIKK